MDDPDYSMKMISDLRRVGFIDETRTRKIRVRLLLYNSGLPLMCSLNIEASLSATGVMRTKAETVRQALPRSPHRLPHLLW